VYSLDGNEVAAEYTGKESHKRQTESSSVTMECNIIKFSLVRWRHAPTTGVLDDVGMSVCKRRSVQSGRRVEMNKEKNSTGRLRRRYHEDSLLCWPTSNESMAL